MSSASCRSALLKLDFLIIGGGIAGLACAYELSRCGHRVRVLEKSSGLGQRAGGIRVPPNLTKILLEWGLQDELAKLANRVLASTFYSVETGEAIGYLEWKEDVILETGADFLLMTYDDLHRLIYHLATSTGTKVTYEACVTKVSVDHSAQTACAFLANGEVMTADIIIGADGYRSIVRDVVTKRDNNGRPSGMSILTATIPVETMKADPELYALATTPEWPMWMGDSCSVLCYQLHQGNEYAVHIFWQDSELPPGNVEEGWDIIEPMHSSDIMSPCEPRIRRMLSLIPDVLRTKYVERDPVEEWADESRRLVLIGEAAHPLLPCSMHGPSLAVEDAVVFGTLFSHLRNHRQIPILIEAYQDLRLSRCKTVGEGELNNGNLIWLPPGSARDRRDADMKASRARRSEHWDEGQLRKQWEEIAGVFGYCARDAAEDWWVNWGVLMERSESINPLEFKHDMTADVSMAPLKTVEFTEVVIYVT